MIDTQRYHRDGIVFPAGQVDVSGFATGYARFQSDSRRLRGRETYLKPHLVSAWLDEVVRLPAIVDVVEQIIGPDIVLWESDWSVKRTARGRGVHNSRPGRPRTRPRIPQWLRRSQTEPLVTSAMGDGAARESIWLANSIAFGARFSSRMIMNEVAALLEPMVCGIHRILAVRSRLKRSGLLPIRLGSVCRSRNGAPENRGSVPRRRP